MRFADVGYNSNVRIDVGLESTFYIPLTTMSLQYHKQANQRVAFFPCVQELGDPEKILSGFSLELFKEPLREDAVFGQTVEEHDGLAYYYW